MLSGMETLNWVDQTVKKEFESNRRILSFDEYLTLFCEKPEVQMRGSAQYVVDTLDYFGTDGPRYKLFDFPVDGIAPKVVGHENVQGQIYRALKAFARQGVNNKLLLLHGPNGSAKSSLIHAMMGGLEKYSRLPEGALYSFNWIFPIERYTRGNIGINTYGNHKEPLTHYAKLPDEEISSRIGCELKDHPLLLIPQEQRQKFIENLIGAEKAETLWEHLPSYLKRGDLCHRCKNIFDALLGSYGGDLKRLLFHVQVERVYLSRRYRRGLVTIEPQLHVDAQYHPMSYGKNMGTLPASLQGMHFFSVTGDLIDGNRGLVEFSDLLKRPVDAFKYLLGACETGSINIGNSIAGFDTLFFGSANEVQLDSFKEFPDFTSFKARIELIRVPYLLSISQEEQIYHPQLAQIAGEKHVAPHVAATIATWSVLTRLKKPNSINYAPNVSAMISSLSPIEKARIYDSGELPTTLTPEDRKTFRGSLRKLSDEYSNVPYYEGRMGASAREMKSVLFNAAQSTEFPCLSPLAVLRELEDFVKRVTEYDFLNQEIKDGYHDAIEFIQTSRKEYSNRIDREVRDSIGLYESNQWEDFLKKYVQQISVALKKEKVKNSITGKLEDPDFALISEFEKIVEAPQEPSEREAFRQNVISQIGVWSLDHPQSQVVYSKVFPNFWQKLEKHYFVSQKALLSKMSEALVVYTSEQEQSTTEGAQLARKTVLNMKQKHGYCDLCAREVIIFLMKQRY